MEPEIRISAEKKLVGKHLTLTLANDRTYELWSSFMPRRKEIRNSLTTDLISMQVYDKSTSFAGFTQDTPFEKWDVVE